MNITTKQGDDGFTQVAPDRRVSKASTEVEFLGSIDELQVAIGGISLPMPEIHQMLSVIQKDLFTVASMIYNSKNQEVVSQKVTQLEQWQLQITKRHVIEYDWHLTTPETYFIDRARVTTRRSERLIVRLFEQMELGERARIAQLYLNRLSDFLWIVGRLVKPKPYHTTDQQKDKNLQDSFE